jgi:hypothetical protein
MCRRKVGVQIQEESKNGINFSALTARCARATKGKYHVALPLVIMGVFYWLSSLPGTPLPDDPALYAVFYWVPPSV